MGPCDDATDGEHPPVYLPSMSSGDNRCAMNKALKGSVAERPSKLPQRKPTLKRMSSIQCWQNSSNLYIYFLAQSPVPTQRNDSLTKRESSLTTHVPMTHVQITANSNDTTSYVAFPYNSPIVQAQAHPVPKSMAATYKHMASNVPSPKGSPSRRQPVNNSSNTSSPQRQRKDEEQWVDGPRLSKTKVAEARHLLREINHVKQKEQWIDGPKMLAKSTAIAGTSTTATPSYGYMDSHKKTMIRQWVENQTSQIFQPASPPSVMATETAASSRQTTHRQLTSVAYQDQDQQSVTSSSHYTGEMVNPVSMTFGHPAVNSVECSIRVGLKQMQDRCTTVDSSQEEEDQDSGPSEVPPALPLIEPLTSREISTDSIHRLCSRHVSRESLIPQQQQQHQLQKQQSLQLKQQHQLNQTKDCGLQVSEDDIVREMR